MNLESVHHAPTVEEIAARVVRVQDKMAEQGLDWYAVFQPDNIYYLTNFANFVHERPFILLIPAGGTPRFLVPLLEIPHVKSRSVGPLELIEYFEFPAPEGENWFDKMKAVLSDARNVGVESVCPLQVYQAIEAERVCSDIVDDLRMVKSPYEMGRMLHAARIGSMAMRDLLDNAQPGRSLGEVQSRGAGMMFEMLCRDQPSLNPKACRMTSVFHPARFSHDPHNFGDLDMRMEEGGPHVSIINAVMNGYGTEIERTFFIGHVPEAARKPYQVMMEARMLAFELARPGTPMRDVDKAVNTLFKKAGYEDNLLHRAGHGMGVTGHEAPFLAEGDPRIIEPGMSFTIEPGIYFPGTGGFRHSDTILITEDGNRVLTEAQDSLADMTL